MLKVIDIIYHLPEAHGIEIRRNLDDQQACAVFCLQLFDAYRMGKSEETAKIESDLSHQEFKIIERLVYRSVIDFYQLEDKSLRDLLPGTLFYALNGSIERNIEEKKELFQELFHQMKHYELDEEALPLINELLRLFENTPLSGVYAAMRNYYSRVMNANRTAVSLFGEFNQIVQLAVKEPGKDNILRQIALFKMIRKIADNNNSKTAIAIQYLCRAILVIQSKQEQILKDGNWSKKALLTVTKDKIARLPFGIKRFYLQNIWNEIKQLHAQQEGLYNAFTIRAKDQGAYNFGFPNLIKIQSIDYNAHHQLSLKGSNLAIKVINRELNSSIKRAFGFYYLQSLRLSHPI